MKFAKIPLDLKHTCVMYIYIKECALNLILIVMKDS